MADYSHAHERAGRHVVILSHPDPDSFNHAIAKTYCDAVRFYGQDPQKHVHFGHITDELSERFADQHLHDVKEQARHICAEVAVSNEALLPDPSLAGAISN